ncbi:metallo-beta-lactamase superfamily [Hyphomonas neptunium ATCC 15444]|uniref:Metallo-beta-lactamase superfamily n=2 Tax=Hyphomonas TaxID=85 RepID=Q0C4Y0_HYPNA|nr:MULTISPECIES: MBL fold metallo-hydrolase [Hyphomonas]ABI77399.1 metallo-beta-lactamase superfamily [Hyphomonas neptunium ATCC 15444]KCZ83932.1 metallo-beta-lactamase superfamily protein [Hyphomonas hirschiana VP5]
MPEIKPFFDPATNTVTYLVWDKATRDAVIIDPVLDFDPAPARLSTASADKVLAAAEAEGLKIRWALDTHAHADHLSAADYVRQKTGAKVGIGAHITDVQKIFRPMFGPTSDTPDETVFDALFNEGDEFPLGNETIRVLHTPGHTAACLTYLIGDAAFVGDTVFMPDYGTARADFPGGDAHALYRSIRKLLALPPETRIFTGHDYLPEGRDKHAWESTVAQHRAANVHVHDGVSEEDFVTMRTTRDKTLGAPRLILPSLQVNIRAGTLPPPESDGQTYLRLPVNRLGK